MDGTYSNGNARRVCVSSCFPYVDISHCENARQGYTPFKRRVFEVGCCPCSDKRMGAVSIVNGIVCGRFRECWHERFEVFCHLLQVH
jgi:hypothetical protein